MLARTPKTSYMRYSSAPLLKRNLQSYIVQGHSATRLRSSRCTRNIRIAFLPKEKYLYLKQNCFLAQEEDFLHSCRSCPKLATLYMCRVIFASANSMNADSTQLTHIPAWMQDWILRSPPPQLLNSESCTHAPLPSTHTRTDTKRCQMGPHMS